MNAKDTGESAAARPRRRWYLRKKLLVPLALLVILAGYLTYDYYPPLELPLEQATAFGMPCLRAPRLVVQGHDPDGHLWASRGMWTYRLWKGDRNFVRQYHVPTGLNLHWTRNFTLVRWLSSRDVCIEVIPTSGGGSVAASGGYIWYRLDGHSSWDRTHKLRYFGIGVGSGLRPPGIARLKDGTIMYGEYWRNPEIKDVRLYASRDGGKTWQVAYTWGPGEIRHVHGVQQDPYSGKVWICTGDTDSQSRTVWTDDYGKTIHTVGQGLQRWRVCQFAFTPEAVYWGADTGNEDAGIWRCQRDTEILTKLAYVPACILYATTLADGTIVLGSDVEDARNEIDDKARLWVVSEGDKVQYVTLGAWTRPKLFKGFAWPRLSRTPGDTHLFLSCLNMTPHDGDLLVISPAILRQVGLRSEWMK